jgi:precorrin-8X/cobalt-precorrin-8 methylmutase
VGDALARQRAEQEQSTRSALGIRLAAEQGLVAGGIVAVGNAPTALYETIRLIRETDIKPALVIGVPVGFVEAAESKAALTQVDAVPWIVTEGRKGGSTIAVAIINALLRLAADAPPTAVD